MAYRRGMGAVSCEPNRPCPGKAGDACTLWPFGDSGAISPEGTCYTGPTILQTISAVALPDYSKLPPPAPYLPPGPPAVDTSGNPLNVLTWPTTQQQVDASMQNIAGSPFDPSAPWYCRYLGIGCSASGGVAAFSGIGTLLLIFGGIFVIGMVRR